MKLTRRQFIGLVGAAGLAGCARTGLDKITDVDLVPGGPGRVTFAAINDIHVLDSRSISIVVRAAEMINATDKVRFTVALGDLASDGQLGELSLAYDALSRLEKPWFAIPGNHDVNMGAKDILNNYRKFFGEPDHRQEDEGWLFIGIDSCNENKSDVAIRPDQIDWLKKQLKHTNGKRPIALFTHHPFNPNTKAYRVQNADEVLGLFSEHNLKLVASGHFHGNQEETRDGILFTTTACCSSTRDNHDGTTSKGFRLFHLDKDSVTTEYVEVVA
ncbi:MAG: metallophosphoesterase [Candidatus Hydrogenedentes bacterium]|nr:metallophosphoesterase [Candidatus Hydrogenedentota bacterium]